MPIRSCRVVVINEVEHSVGSMKFFYCTSLLLLNLLFLQNGCAQQQIRPAEPRVIVSGNEPKKTTTETKHIYERPRGDIKSTYPNLKKEADLMIKAFLAEDFERYTDFMHPVPVQAVDGRKSFISSLVSTIANLRSNGIEFVSFEIGEPIQAIEMDNKVFVVLTYESRMKNQQRITSEEGNILAVSEDKGARWMFIRATSKERLRFLFPDLVDRLNFPGSRTK